MRNDIVAMAGAGRCCVLFWFARHQHLPVPIEISRIIIHDVAAIVCDHVSIPLHLGMIPEETKHQRTLGGLIFAIVCYMHQCVHSHDIHRNLCSVCTVTIVIFEHFNHSFLLHFSYIIDQILLFLHDKTIMPLQIVCRITSIAIQAVR